MFRPPTPARKDPLQEEVCTFLETKLLPSFDFGDGFVENLTETWECLVKYPMPSMDDMLSAPADAPHDVAYALCLAMGSQKRPACAYRRFDIAVDSKIEVPLRTLKCAIALNLSVRHTAYLGFENESMSHVAKVSPGQFVFVPDTADLKQALQLDSVSPGQGSLLLFFYPDLTAPLCRRTRACEFHGLIEPPSALITATKYPDDRHYFALSLFSSGSTLARFFPRDISLESTLLFQWIDSHTRMTPECLPGLPELRWFWMEDHDVFLGLPLEHIDGLLHDPIALSTIFLCSSEHKSVAQARAFLQTVLPGVKEARSITFSKAARLEDEENVFD